MQPEAENWRLYRTTAVRGASGELEDENRLATFKYNSSAEQWSWKLRTGHSSASVALTAASSCTWRHRNRPMTVRKFGGVNLETGFHRLDLQFASKLGHTPHTRGIRWVKSPECVRFDWRTRMLDSFWSICSCRKLPPPAFPQTACSIFSTSTDAVWAWCPGHR